MDRENARLIVLGSLLADLLLVAAAFLAAYWLRNDLLLRLGLVESRLYPLGDYMVLLVVALISVGVMLIASGKYRVARPSRWSDARLILVCVAMALTVLLWAYFARPGRLVAGAQQISRIWFLAFTLLSIVLLKAKEVVGRRMMRARRQRGYNLRRVLIAGSAAGVAKLADILRGREYSGFEVVGAAADRDVVTGIVPDCSYLGTFDAIPRLVEEHVIDEVIFAIGRNQIDSVENLLLMLEERGISTRLLIDLFPHVRARLQVRELDGIPLLSYSTVPTTVLRLLLKRAFDIVVAVVMLVVLAPLLALIALAIKMTSEGDVLFRQVRCGLNGRHFVFYKFRTMVQGAEDLKQDLEHLNEAEGPVFKIARDPRVTRLGRTLRKFSLDELPQLWNVLKGDMSLVGPRPPVPEEVSKYEAWQRRRLSMRPGLTCLWQVRGRSTVGFDDWMRLDLAYIDRWSLSLDLQILLRTIPAVVLGRGAW